MNTESGKPLEQAVRNINESVVNAANVLASLPEAAARGVVDRMHGEGASEKVAGEFNSKPVSGFVESLKRRGTSCPER